MGGASRDRPILRTVATAAHHFCDDLRLEPNAAAEEGLLVMGRRGKKGGFERGRPSGRARGVSCLVLVGGGSGIFTALPAIVILLTAVLPGQSNREMTRVSPTLAVFGEAVMVWSSSMI